MVNKTKIVLIGLFHMKEYPVFIPNKQDEIIELVNYISEYNPTKIAVEWAKENEVQLNDEYRKFLDGGWQKTDEIYELGFLDELTKVADPFPFSYQTLPLTPLGYFFAIFYIIEKPRKLIPRLDSPFYFLA